METFLALIFGFLLTVAGLTIVVLLYFLMFALVIGLLSLMVFYLGFNLTCYLIIFLIVIIGIFSFFSYRQDKK